MTAAARAPDRERALARIPLYPLLLAAWPVLRLYGDNANEFAVAEVVLPLILAVGLAILAMVVATVIWREPRRAAMVASAFVVPFLTFGLIATTAAPLWPHEPLVRAYLLTLAMWVAIVIVTAYVATKLRGRLGVVTEALNVLAMLLVMLALVPAVLHQLSSRSTADPSTSERVAASSQTELARQPDRDIYHIVFDRYGSEEALAVGMGIDNSDFVDSLRARGFQVVGNAHANFERTVPSLAATFSMSLLDDVVERMGPDNPSWAPLYDMVKASPVGSTLQDLGYRYVHVGSWYHQTATSTTADQVERPVHLVDLSSVLVDQSAITGLWAIADVMTSLEPNGSDQRLVETTLTQLDRLHDVAARPGPQYVFAHLLIPHEPYLLMGDGSFSPEEATFGTQLEFSNAEIDRLLARLLHVPPDEQPIILIQGEEGPYPARYQPEIDDFDWATATNEELVTKFGVLNAMFLPGPEGTVPLPAGISLVNTYPEILSRYFGIDVERAPDRILTTPDDRPYDRLDITEQVMRAEQELGLAEE